MPPRPYRTLDDVVNGLAAIEAGFLRQRDHRSIFATLYGVVSAEIRSRVAAGAFEDPPWVHRYAVSFANLYQQALLLWEDGSRATAPKAWRLAFEAAAGENGFVLQHLLLGINAHVNHDLPYAIDGIGIGADREARYRDHSAVNAVLAAVTERATQRIASLYAPGLAVADECAGQLDEVLSLFSLSVARDSAWESALALANARTPRERSFSMSLIGARAAGMARLLLAPSSNRVLVEACRRVEAGPEWLLAVHDAVGRHRREAPHIGGL
jgi:hypothetical protein